MPKGLRRFHHTGDWHFITCSCYRRQGFLDSFRRRDIFLKTMMMSFNQKKYVEKLRYIHRNRAKRGLVPSPELMEME